MTALCRDLTEIAGGAFPLPVPMTRLQSGDLIRERDRVTRALAIYLTPLERVRSYPTARMMPAHGAIGRSLTAGPAEVQDHDEDRLKEIAGFATDRRSVHGAHGADAMDRPKTTIDRPGTASSRAGSARGAATPQCAGGKRTVGSPTPAGTGFRFLAAA